MKKYNFHPFAPYFLIALVYLILYGPAQALDAFLLLRYNGIKQ